MRYLIPPLDSLPLQERWEVQTRKRRRRIRKPTLASVAKQAAKAGIEVARYEVDETGKIIVVIGKAATPDFRSGENDASGIDPNEWN